MGINKQERQLPTDFFILEEKWVRRELSQSLFIRVLFSLLAYW